MLLCWTGVASYSHRITLGFIKGILSLWLGLQTFSGNLNKNSSILIGHRRSQQKICGIIVQECFSWFLWKPWAVYKRCYPFGHKNVRVWSICRWWNQKWKENVRCGKQSGKNGRLVSPTSVTSMSSSRGITRFCHQKFALHLSGVFRMCKSSLTWIKLLYISCPDSIRPFFVWFESESC